MPRLPGMRFRPCPGWLLSNVPGHVTDREQGFQAEQTQDREGRGLSPVGVLKELLFGTPGTTSCLKLRCLASVYGMTFHFQSLAWRLLSRVGILLGSPPTPTRGDEGSQLPQPLPNLQAWPQQLSFPCTHFPLSICKGGILSSFLKINLKFSSLVTPFSSPLS